MNSSRRAWLTKYEVHGIGGEEVQHTLLARALTARGYEVPMVVMDFGQADGARWEGINTYKAYRSEGGLPVLRFLAPYLDTFHRLADRGVRA
jgi:hypothetical protein